MILKEQNVLLVNLKAIASVDLAGEFANEKKSAKEFKRREQICQLSSGSKLEKPIEVTSEITMRTVWITQFDHTI